MVALAVGIFLLTAILLILGSWKVWTARYSHWTQPGRLPWIGTVLSLPYLPHPFFKRAQEWATKHEHLFLLWLGPLPFIVTSRADYVEAILSSKTLLKKSYVYNFLHEWLGTGLLTSYAHKWKNRRRAITPTFHFSILNGFAVVFEEQAKILVEKLKSVADSGETINVQAPVSLAKLDIICETSMGVNVNAQSSPTSAYVEAINSLHSCIQVRQKSPWLWPKFIYQLTPPGRLFYKSLNIVHNFTIDVINKSIARRKDKRMSDVKADEEAPGKRMFLDMLLDLYDKGEIDVEGIREEVDTFMFEGHDTTASGLSWTLYELARRPDLQERLYEEIVNVDPELDIIEKVKSIKYLDYVLKEGLRLHPPVPIYARSVETDTVIDNKVIPKGTEIGVFTYMLHRNPMYWDDPDTFNPDRFGTEEFLKRDPYIYVPFSAGSRNCVGQKFAMLEEKIVMYYLVLNYKFTSDQEEGDVLGCMEIVHKSENGLFLSFQSR